MMFDDAEPPRKRRCLNFAKDAGVQQNETHPSPPDQVCFGMITDISVQPSLHLPHYTERSFALCFIQEDGTILDARTYNQIGTAGTHVGKALWMLSSQEGILLQISCAFGLQRAPKGGKSATEIILSAIVYGNSGLGLPVGDFLQKCDLYLQDPEGCAWNLPYQNPHRMSRGGKLKMTFDLPRIQQAHVAKKFQGATDFFANLEAEEDDQVDSPQGLRTKILPHQQRALAFMLRREGGWIYDRSRRDLWTMNQDILGQTFTNNVTGHLHKDPPPDFRGGLLADEMGLGKTLSMIALIVSDKDPRMQRAPCAITPTLNQEWSSNATLVIVPSPLLQVWNAQLEQHTYPGRVQWVIYHGSRRLSALSQAGQPDIVITTFQTIASEYGHGKNQSSPIFTAYWKRIVLDEAHIIRERNTMTAKAIRALSAERRWALTGTPVQNRMADFASLLEFLRVHPYNDHKAFERDISLPCVDGCGEEGIRRLKTLVGCIVLRRRTTIIQLPPRHDEIRPLEFSPEERDFYDKASSPIKIMLDNALDDHDSSAEVFLGAFQLINRLRKICNLGVSAIPSSSTIASPPPENSWGVSTSQIAFETLLSMDQAKCSNCLQEVGNSTDLSTTESLSLPTSLSPRIFRCLKVLCGPCSAQPDCGIACGHSPACPSEAVFTSASAPSTPLASRPEPGSPVSSKIKALVEDVLEHPDEKSVIFSYWTTSLDAVECALEDSRVGYVRFDGQTSSGNRKMALRRLQHDPSVRVMLITVGCGAVGLDLTAASRIYLLEPQWNPTTEDQALARIHRMGQKRPVTTIRFVMKDSFEEHVMKVQDRKRQLADLLFSGGKQNSGEKTHARLSHLRSLLG